MTITHPYQGHLLQPAFEGFVSFASKHDDFIAAFLAEHPGCLPPRSGFEAMIDKAAGRDEAVFQEFVNWCVGQFGTPDEIQAT